MTNDVVEVSVTIAAKPATVYAFLTEPSQFAQWMGPGSGIESRQSGDTFRIQYASGDLVVGQILETIKNRRVVYSWGYRTATPGPPPGSTRVTFELERADGGTRLTVRHEGLMDQTQRQGHEQGWRFHAGRLAVLAIQAEAAAVLTPLLDAYALAWNETDPDARRRALDVCWDEAGVYRDRLARIEGRHALFAYIQSVQAFAPGLRLELTDERRQCQECATFGWTIVDGAGRSVGGGTCFGEVSREGRLSRVTSFWNGDV
jgi:uncharacterized protein YndB with AHSA1/START domain